MTPEATGHGRQPRRGAARELRILNAIAEALNSAPDVKEALARTLALVADRLGLKTGWVWLLDAETGQFYSGGAQNLPPYLQEPIRMRGGSCWCIDDFRAGKLTPTNIDVMECSRLRPAVQQALTELTEGLRSHASVPLYFGDKPLGILNVTAPAWRELTRDELRLLSTIAYQVGIAVERARLAEESTRLARVEERARIARDIHDTLAQGLTAIALQLEGALNQLDRNPDRARERVVRALATARENLDEARRSVVELRAAPLAGKPLGEALAVLGRRFSSDSGVRVHVAADPALALPLKVEAELYRIAQEALSNVRKWAEAREVRVTLRRLGGAAVLTIQDDGRGFESRRRPAGGHGLLGMRERARALGGRLRIEGRRRGAATGTRVVVTVPLVDGTGTGAGDGEAAP